MDTYSEHFEDGGKRNQSGPGVKNGGGEQTDSRQQGHLTQRGSNRPTQAVPMKPKKCRLTPEPVIVKPNIGRGGMRQCRLFFEQLNRLKSRHSF